MVKKAKALAARAAAGWKWPLALFAAVSALMRTPASTQAAVAADHARAPLGDMGTIYGASRQPNGAERTHR